jgi:hypothetical protein
VAFVNFTTLEGLRQWRAVIYHSAHGLGLKIAAAGIREPAFQ